VVTMNICIDRAASHTPRPSPADDAAVRGHQGNRSPGSEDASRHIEGSGTPDAAWQAWGGLAALPPVSAATLVPPGRRAVIVAPHPDDEVLACGGLLQLLQAQGTQTVLVAVTDGDASHPDSALLTPADLTRIRPQETLAALRALGFSDADGLAPAPQILRARIADGQVGANLEQLQNLLNRLLRPDDVVFVTWRQDGHPDHEACGLTTALAARACRAALVEMPVWSWHWAAPGDTRLPWGRARRLALSADVLQRKRQAVDCFKTQLHGDASNGQPAVLPAHVLARLLHPYEIYFT
jgi:LmbE family N-acetylglucosaminyl deacetylase